ncbi:hypothetical protein IQ07DRAFT_584286 [Pyrenochaeta sp. DS3sAY3a]|nr:hypothetical protein IQ07DRAFT_584286 [Pyrenochaeta sp. DS3sAY3a]
MLALIPTHFVYNPTPLSNSVAAILPPHHVSKQPIPSATSASHTKKNTVAARRQQLGSRGTIF